MKSTAIIRLSILSALFFVSSNLWGQKTDSASAHFAPKGAPIYLEPFIGVEGTSVYTIFSKPLTPKNKFGIFSIAEYYGVYKTEDQKLKNQFMAQTHLTYELVKNLKISAGAIITQATGFRPTVGMQYYLMKKDFAILIAPRFDLSQTYNGEVFSFIEYKPQFKNHWGLYVRIQGLYNQDIKDNIHAFSYVRARVGASYDTFRFGLSSNTSFYGPTKTNENQFGVFVGALIF